jgi:Bacteriophage abortive infection AbiH
MSMILVIIGNGFDLAHGLKTSFKQFAENILLKKAEDSSAYPEIFWPGFTLQKKEASVEAILKRSPSPILNGFLLSCLRASAAKNWYDYEAHYFDQLWLNPQKPHLETLHKDVDAFKIALKRYLLEEEKKHQEISDMRYFFDALGKKGSFEIVNFNYTSTVQKYLSNEYHEKQLHIHGKLDGEILFGYSPSLETENAMRDKNEFEYLRNVKQDVYASTPEYQKIIALLARANKLDVFVLGHSLADCDQILLEKILRKENSRIYLFSNPLEESGFRRMRTKAIKRIGNDIYHQNETIESEKILMPQFNHDNPSFSDNQFRATIDKIFAGLRYNKLTRPEIPKKP